MRATGHAARHSGRALGAAADWCVEADAAGDRGRAALRLGAALLGTGAVGAPWNGGRGGGAAADADGCAARGRCAQVGCCCLGLRQLIRVQGRAGDGMCSARRVYAGGCYMVEADECDF